MNITGLKKSAVLATLYNASKPQGMGFMHYDSTAMTEAEAEKLLAMGTHFDYLKGRVMKIDLSEDELDTRLYNRDNGVDSAENAIAELKKSSQVLTPKIEKIHKMNTRASIIDTMGRVHEKNVFSVEGDMATVSLGLGDMAPYLKPAIKRAKEGLKKSMTLVINSLPKTTFRPLSRGRFRCNQTGDLVKANQTQSYARNRAMSGS